jgi:hypothetical protein
MERRIMSNRFRTGLVFSLFVLMLFSAPSLRSQQADEKAPVDKGAPEQKVVEKNSANASGRLCDLTTCPAKFFYFHNLSQPTELQDFVNSLRTIAEIARIQQIPSEQLVIVRGTPEQLGLAARLADEIDKEKRRFGGEGYRLDFKVSESEGEKKLRSRNYSLVTEGRESARLSMGRPAPTPASAPSQNGASPDKKQSPDAVAGRHIECRVVAENERTIELFVDAAFCSSRMKQPVREERASLQNPGSADPTLLCVRDRVILELGKPTVIARADDPDGERTFQLEVTATRVLEKQ